MPCPTIQALMERIITIWKDGERFISLCFFHHVTSNEGYSREACMIRTIGESSLSPQYIDNPTLTFSFLSLFSLCPSSPILSLDSNPPSSGLGILTNKNKGHLHEDFENLLLIEQQRFGIYFLYKAYCSYLDGSATLFKYRYGSFLQAFPKTLYIKLILYVY